LFNRLFFEGMLFRLRNRSCNFRSRPIIYGLWPRITNDGSISFGHCPMFRSSITPLRIVAEKNSSLKIGDYAYLGEGISIISSVSINIGDYAKIASGVYISDNDRHAISPERAGVVRAVEIGRNVWIGGKAIILAGSTIGDHAVIGAGSVVRGVIPPRCVAAGNPAKVIKTFEAPDDRVRK
jgi:acetyltransferase-like isoleucine patch superfamily enzyme